MKKETHEISEYEQQAIDFAEKWNVSFEYQFEYRDRYFIDDTKERDIYWIRLMTAKESYGFEFGQSINNSSEYVENRIPPALYDVLACLTKSDPGSFEDFCNEFGYNDRPLSDYPKVKKIYKGVKAEYKAVMRLFGDNEDCLEELREIA